MPRLRRKGGPERRAARAARAERATWAADGRLPLSETAKAALRKAFPDHWSFLLGELALYSFIVLVLTGIYLTFFFHPDMAEQPYTGSYGPLRGVQTSQAYASVLHISFDVRGGLLIRQIHHWGALVFIAAIGVHLLRIFFTGAFRRPREVNWTIGVTMFGLSLLEGFCGYSLPDDLLSGTGLRTAQGIMLSIPIVGSYVSFFAFGGEYPAHEIIPRLYSFHILLLPGLLIALISVHLFLVVYLKHTQWAEPRRTNRNAIGSPFFPQYTAKSVGLFLLVFAVLTVLGAVMQINPVWDFGPYRTDQVSIDAQPDWYVGFLEGALRMMPAAETDLWGHTVVWDVFLPGAVLPTLIFAILYAYPFLERWIAGGGIEYHLCDRPRNQPTRTGLGVAAVSVYAVLLFAGAQDVIAYVFRLPVQDLTYGFRTLFFVLPVLSYWLTKRLCLGLQAHDRARIAQGDETGEVRQTRAGAYQEGRTVLAEETERMLLVRGTPRPLTSGGRVRKGLHSWYFAHRVELPATEEQRRRIADILADPTEAEEREKAEQ